MGSTPANTEKEVHKISDHTYVDKILFTVTKTASDVDSSGLTPTPDAFVTIQGRYCQGCALDALNDASIPGGALAGRFEVCGPVSERAIDQYVIPVTALTDGDKGNKGVVEGSFEVSRAISRWKAERI